MQRTLVSMLLCTTWTLLACHPISASPDARCGDFVSPGLKLLSTSEMTPSDREVFTRRATGAQPGCVLTDFNSDGVKDAALIGKDSKSGTVLLVIALAKQGGGFRPMIRNPLGDSLAGMFLLPYNEKSIEPTEAVEGPDTAHKLKGGAVQLVFVEKAAVVYFWDEAAGKFAELQTSD